MALLAVLASGGLALGGFGCRKSSAPAAGSVRGGPPKGDAVWFTDVAAAGDAGIEDRLARIAAAVFLPAGEVTFGNGRWGLRAGASPPHPLSRAPVILAVRAGAELSSALAGEAGPDPEAVSQAIAAGLEPALRAGGPFGRVVGLHLDFPFTAASAKRSGALLEALRHRFPSGPFLSIAAPFPSPATEEARKALAPLVDKADALVAPIFGLEARSDAAAIDSLRRPWWAAFAASPRAVIVRSDGGPPAACPEEPLEALSGDSRVDFENDLSVSDASFSAFHLTVRRPVRAGELAFEAGDRITYRVPALTEMLYQLGSTMSGKRFALGRVLVFDGTRDASRIYPVAAFEDVILGRSLAPVLAPGVVPAGRNAIAVEAANRTAHASIVSRTSNWIEVDVAPAHPADVNLGGFDRYATYDRNGQPVTPGRATRVRLFETLVLPGEVVSPARIVLRGGVPARCCPSRAHLIAAAGSEVASEWTEPPAPPTPTAAPHRKKR